MKYTIQAGWQQTIKTLIKNTVFAILIATLSFASTLSIVAPQFISAFGVVENVVWRQDFSSDTGGWLDGNSGWHGLISFNTADQTATISQGDSATGPFSRFDGYRSTWPGSYVAEIDVYLDPSWSEGTAFDYSVASNGSDGAHQRDFVFHVESYGENDLRVGATNNSRWSAFPENPAQGNLSASNQIESAGWHTLQHKFIDDDGVLAAEMNVLDEANNTVFTTVRSSSSDAIGEVGGNRYAWFTFVSIEGGVKADNHKLTIIEERGPVHNSSTGIYYDTIQEALDSASVGNVIEVSSSASPYSESPSISTEGVELVAVDETVEIHGGVSINADNAKLTGFTLKGDETSDIRGISVAASSSDVTINENSVYGFTTGVTLNEGTTGAVIDENYFSGNMSGVGSTENSQALRVTENTFDGNEEGVGLGVGVSVEDISGNEFNGNDENVRYWGAINENISELIKDIWDNNEFTQAAIVRGSPIVVPAIFTSIQDAIDAASDGNTVEVGPGTYSENLEILTDGLTLVSTDGADDTVIDAGGATNAVSVGNNADTGGYNPANTYPTNFTFEGFTVTGWAERGFSQRVGTGAMNVTGNVFMGPVTGARNGINISGGTGSKLTNNIITTSSFDQDDWSGTGILLMGSNETIVSGNTVDGADIGVVVAGYADWAYIDTSWTHAIENEITGNTILGNGNGIGLAGNAYASEISENTIEDNSRGVNEYPQAGGTPKNNVVSDNSFVDNSWGIRISSALLGSTDYESMTLLDNDFTQNNPYNVRDFSQTLDLLTVLNNNTFDRATIEGSHIPWDDAFVGEVEIQTYYCPDGTNVNWNSNGPEGDAPEDCVTGEGIEFGYIPETSKPIGDTTGPWLVGEEDNIDDATFLSDSEGLVTIDELSVNHRYGLVIFDGQGNLVQSNDDVLFFACDDDSSNGGNPGDRYEFAFPASSQVKHCVAYLFDDAGPSVSDATLDGENVDDGHIRSENCEDIIQPYLVSGEINFSAMISDDLTDVESASYRVRKVNSNGCTVTSVFSSGMNNLQYDTNEDRWLTTEAFDTNQIKDDGTYTIMLVTEDSVGNQTTSYIDLLVDNTNPTFSIQQPSDGSVISGDTEIVASIEDESGIQKVLMTVPMEDGNKTFVYENGKTNNSLEKNGDKYSVTVDTNEIQDGVTYVTLRGTDKAGNTRYWNNNANNRQHSFTVDNAAPVISDVTVDSPVAGLATIEFMLNDETGIDLSPGKTHVRFFKGSNLIGSAEVQSANTFVTDLGSGRHQAVIDTTSFAPSGSEGEYWVYIRAEDTLGNAAGNNSTRGIVIDNRAPQAFDITVPSPSAGSVEVRFKLDETNSVDMASGKTHVRFYRGIDLNNATAQSTNSPVTYDASTDEYVASIDTTMFADEGSGEYWVYIRAEDTLGNAVGNNDVRGITVDNTAPVAEIVNPVDGDVVSGVVSLEGEVSDENPMNTYFRIEGPDGYIQTSLYQDGRSTHEYEWNTEGLEDGEYIIYFETRDMAGNKEGSRSNTSGDSVDSVVVEVLNSTITDLVVGTPELSTLLAAVQVAELGGVLADDSSEYTVFAPVDSAFVNLLAELDIDAADLLDSPDLAGILAYHVVEGAVLSGDLTDGQEIETLEGTKLTVEIDGATVFIIDEAGSRAEIVTPDIPASNGVVHLVDAVLQFAAVEESETPEETVGTDSSGASNDQGSGADSSGESAPEGNDAPAPAVLGANTGAPQPVVFAQANNQGQFEEEGLPDDEAEQGNISQSSSNDQQENGEVLGAADDTDESGSMTWVWTLLVVLGVGSLFLLFARRQAEQE